MIALKTIFFLVAVIFSSLLIINGVAAAPSLSSPTPANSSYLFGKDTGVFSVLIVDSTLNTSTAKLHIRVEDPTSTWANVSLSCTNSSATNYNCSSTVSGLSALVQDGDTLLFYFDAYNTNGQYGNNGDATTPLRASVDRSGPKVTFSTPTNNSYAGGNATIFINALDTYSGVQNNSVKYSFDNSTFKDTTLASSLYKSNDLWDTGTYSNNQSVTIYAKAKDKTDVENNTFITVLVDNEKPTISTSTPTPSEIIKGIHPFTFAAQDTYSGLNLDSGFFEIGSLNQSMTCAAGSCNNSFDTKRVSDGEYAVKFFIADKVGNRANYSVNIIIDNNPPTITITSPTSGSSVSGQVTVRATVTDSTTGVNTVQTRWETTGSSSEWKTMTCTATCAATLDFSGLQPATYTIAVKAKDNLNNEATSSVSVVISGSSSSSSSSSSSGTNTSQTSGSSGNGSGTGSQNLPPPVCGNNACEASESCVSCEADCGKCGLDDLPAVISALPKIIVDAILNSPFFDTEEKRIVNSTGIISLIIFSILLVRKLKMGERKGTEKVYKTKYS